MQKYQDQATKNGRPVSGASVLVTTLDGTVATIYSDNSGTVQVNPMISDTDGWFAFYAADGRYNLTISGQGFTTKVIPDILLADPEDLGQSITDYAGVDPTGVQDSSVAAAALKNYVEGNTIDTSRDTRKPMRFPAGIYEIEPQVFSKRVTIQGDGSGCTIIKLKAGATGSLFQFDAQDIGGISIDDMNRSAIFGATLVGNRTDSTTTGASRAVYCPDAGFPITTQYAPSVHMSDVVIEGFTGDGIYLGNNRNWALLDHVTVRYCNDSGLYTLGYDLRATACDFGVNKNYGIREAAGGANIFTGCNIYYNTINVVVDGFSNRQSEWIGCANDGALQEGLYVAPGAAIKKWIGGEFFGNSRAGSGLYSDIRTGSDLVLVGQDHTFSGQKVKLLVETNGTAPLIVWVPGKIDVSGGASTPYTTAVTDAPLQLVVGGDQNFSMYSGGAGGFGGFSGPVKLKDYTVAQLAAMPAANFPFCSVMVSNESGGLVMAFSDGVNWRRVTDRAVVS